MDKKLKIDHDSSWKKIITNLFPHFMEFFIPDLHKDIDYDAGYEFLSTELNKMIPERDKRQVDLLVRVVLKNGKSRFLYIHIEVQSYFDALMKDRMFDYFCRIRHEYEESIVALLIFTGEKVNKDKNVYIYESYGTKVRYEYNTYEVRKQKEEALKANQNPFSLVVLACLFLIDDLKLTRATNKKKEKALSAAGKTEELALWKKLKKKQYNYEFRTKLKFKILELYIERARTNKAYTAEMLEELFVFIDCILKLPQERNRQLITSMVEEVNKDIENQKDMIVTDQNRFILASFLKAMEKDFTIDKFLVMQEKAKRTRVAEKKAEEERLAKIAEQKRAEIAEKKAEKERIAKIVEQKKAELAEKKAEKERIAKIVEQKKAEEERLIKLKVINIAILAVFKNNKKIKEIATMFGVTNDYVTNILKKNKLL